MTANRHRGQGVAKRREKNSRLVHAAVIAIFLALNAGGCTGPSGPADAPRSFEQWSREDQRRYPLRSGNPSPAVRPGPQPATETALPADARFDDYVRYAMRHNPDLEAAFDRWRAALERAPQARTLPDPRVSFAVVLDQVDRSAEYMGERYTLSQMFPWFGKLALGGDMADAQAHAEARRFEAARLQLVDQVARAYFEYAFRQEAVVIARENLELLVHLESVARAMFRAGAASLSDVNRAQIEIGRLDDQVRSLEDFLEVAASDLNAVLGRPAHAPLPAVPAKPSTQIFPELPGYSDDQWIALARQHNPELAASRHDTERQRHAVALARKNYYPDITVGVEYAREGSGRMAMMDEGGSGHGRRDDPSTCRSGAESTTPGCARPRRAWTRRPAGREPGEPPGGGAEGGPVHLSRQPAQVALYGDTLLPMARQTLATTETAYRAGTAGFSDLIDAQRVLLEFALAHERAAADRAQAYTRIQALVGRVNDDGAAIDATAHEGGTPPPSPSPVPEEATGMNERQKRLRRTAMWVVPAVIALAALPWAGGCLWHRPPRPGGTGGFQCRSNNRRNRCPADVHLSMHPQVRLPNPDDNAPSAEWP
jgi:outer membrane protein, heavy metal efflux system